MKHRIIPILVVVAAVTIAGLGYLYLKPGNIGPAAVAIGGPLRLTDQDGKPFDSASLAGKPYAVFFGFTHCPDACPTTLSEIARAEDEIGAPAMELTTLFVTVEFAKAGQIHDMKMDGDVMKMQELTGGLEIPAGATVELKPKSMHLMFIGVNQELVPDMMMNGELTFEKAGKVKVEFMIEPAGTDHSMDNM